jgi:glycosyltransferase involved in cell wall biosynthesis
MKTKILNPSDLPSVSIIMPIRNEARYIARSIGAVMKQDYPEERLEIIVVDGMSTDGTREILHKTQAGSRNLQIVDNPRRIVSTGMNAAIRLARGEIIIRVDGHCEIKCDYVLRCVEHLVNDGVDGVGGPIETVGDTNRSKAIAAAMSSKFGVGNSAFRTVRDKMMLTDTIAFPAYTRHIIDRAGPYDEELMRNQDDDYNYRLRKMGARILLAPDVQSRYYSRDEVYKLWLQYFQYGYWKVRVLQKHPLQMRLRQFVPPTFVCALLLTLSLSSFSRIGGIMFCLIAGSYILANLVASFVTARSQGVREFWLLPLAFTVLHVGYGLGFMIGLVKFWKRWNDQENRLIDQSGVLTPVNSWIGPE